MNCTDDPANLAPFGCGRELAGAYTCAQPETQTNCSCSPGFVPDVMVFVNRDCRVHLVTGYVLLSVPVLVCTFNLAGMLLFDMHKARGNVRVLLQLNAAEQFFLIATVVALLASPRLESSPLFLGLLLIHNLVLSVLLEFGVEVHLRALNSLVRRPRASRFWPAVRVSMRLAVDACFLGTCAWLLSHSPGGPTALSNEQALLFNGMYAGSAISQELYFILFLAATQFGALVPLRNQIAEVQANAPNRSSNSHASGNIKVLYYLTRLDMAIKVNPYLMANLAFMLTFTLIFLAVFKTVPYSWVMIVVFLFTMFACMGVLARQTLKTAPQWMFIDSSSKATNDRTVSSTFPKGSTSSASGKATSAVVVASGPSPVAAGPGGQDDEEEEE